MTRWCALFLAIPLAGCTRSSDDCTCLVENAGVRRTLACGESSCVAGLTLACVDKEQSVQRGTCTEVPPPPPATTAAPDSGSVTPPDRSCDDLRAFCSTSCTTPASASADCQSTASAGDPSACAAWPASSGVLCRP